MNITFTRLIPLLALLITSFSSVKGQLIWPGDFNNNGIVNGADLLYFGYGYGTTGGARLDATTDWVGQTMTSAWFGNFPDGTNFAYGDANGDGTITTADATDALLSNYRQIHDVALIDVNSPTGNPEIDPLLDFHADIMEASLGAPIEFSVNLGTDTIAVDSFYGITFTLSYTPEFVDSVYFNRESGWWIDSTHTNSMNIAKFYTEGDVAYIDIAITRTNHQPITGFGPIGKLGFILHDDANATLPLPFKMEVSQIILMNEQMERLPIWTNTQVVILTTGGGTSTHCPDIIAPVCGNNGVTYLNSCYAEAAGVTVYSEGVCYSDCIDPNLINPNANCGDNYDPVCGCNGITYINECVALANGVTEYSSGTCDNDGCYDANYIVTSSGTSVDENGVIWMDCPTVNEPVCGCNGITYQNACEAEASGIVFYTQGSCASACIDVEEMDPTALCPTVYEPVCGCNGVTYTNSCVAEAAGVTDYTIGVCGASSSWCNEAVPIQCGDFLANETNVGAGNNINYYPNCNNYSFYGPDKVYVFNKTSAGDLQIGMEIITPGLDLDLFLLSDNCSQITCLGQSISNNSQTNNEGIVLEDAPIGTYYIVVDGQHSSSTGSYRLEVNCGYLYCGDATPLSCGVPFNGNNINGQDNVSLYGCGNVYNVENNGPEMVHYFTMTNAGQAVITLTGLSANLELFLLNSCDRGDCIDYSQNSGTNNEEITAWLQPGTYYVVVDGYNGAISNYTVTANCEATGCDFALEQLTSTPTSCGANNGSISISSWGGTPSFIVSYTGPVSGSFYTYSNSCTVSNLPSGTYVVTKTDALGCSDTQTVVVGSQGGLTINLTPHDAACMSNGSVSINITNGSPQYTIYISGQVNASLFANSNNFTIDDLPAGNYTIHISDAYGCSSSQSFVIEHSSGNFSYTPTPEAASCGGLGSVHIQTWNGVPPFNIQVQGPVSGYAHTSATSFNIINLPGGTYSITIEDVNWCQHTEVVTIEENGINMDAYANNAACGAQGSVHVLMTSGTPPFNISWSGPVSASTTINNYDYTIPNLPSGYYSIQVEDANWCSAYDVVQVVTTQGNLSFNVIPIDGTCNQLGALWVDILNGTGPFNVSWWGPSEGSSTVTGDGFDIPNLVGGVYTVQITDASGCSNTQTVTLISGGNLDVDISQIGGGCGQNASINVLINGGSPNYTISWNGPSSGSVTVASNNYTINNIVAGTYTVNVTDSSGCSDYEAIQISTSGSNIDLNPTAINPTCGELGAIWLDILGGVPPFTVSWSGPVSGSTTINNNGYNISGLPAGSYWITVTDGSGCSGTVDQTISTINNLNTTLSGTSPTCNNPGSVSVNITQGTAPYAISWSGTSSGSANSNSPYYVINGLSAGTYQVSVTDANGCTAINNISIYNTGGNINISATPTNVYCGQNGSASISITGGTPSYTIFWTGASTGSITSNSNTAVIPNLIVGNYNITVTDNNGCSGTTSIVIYEEEGAIEVTLVPENGTCSSNGAVHVGISGGSANYTISWSGPSSGTTTTSNSFFNIPDLEAGTYNVSVEDAVGCSSTQSTTVLSGEDGLMITGSLLVNDCGQYNTIWLDIVGGNAPYVITWTGTINGTYTTNDNAHEIQDLPPGTYTVVVTDASGCSDTQTLTIYNAPAELLVLDPTNGACGQLGTINISVIGGVPNYQIAWSGPTSGNTTTASSNYTISNLPSGNYTVTLTDGNWCTDAEVATITNDTGNVDLNGSLIVNDCGQYNTIWLNLNGGWPTFTITWTGPVSGTGSTDENGFEIQDLPPGTYTVTLTDAHGCTDTETFTIYEAPIELLTLTPVNGDCGELGSIITNVTGGAPNYQIAWSGPSSGSITTAAPSYIIQDLPSGNYTVTLTDGNWCTDVEVVTIANATGNVDLNGSLIVNDCGQYNTIWLNLDGGWPTFTITWTGPVSGTGSTDENGFEIQDLPPGTYTVTLTDAHGCTDTETFTIYEAPIELLTLTPINGACGEMGSIITNIIGGTPDYQITWAGPTSGSMTTSTSGYTIQNLPSGNYTVTLTDGNWCTDVEVVTITNGTSDLDLNGSLIYNDCGQYNTIWLNLIGGWGPYTITWTGTESGSGTTSENGFEIQDLPPGTYTVKLTDMHGCMDTQVFTIYDAPVELLVLTGFNGACGETGSIQTSIIGGTPNYQITWSGPLSGNITTSSANYIIPNLPSGTYTVTLVDGNWCTDVEVVTITNESSDLDLNGSLIYNDCGQYNTIWLNLVGGWPPYTITWTGVQSGSGTTSENGFEIQDLPPGTYIVKLTDAHGCMDTETFTIYDAPIELLTLTANNGDCGDTGSILANISSTTPDFQLSWTGPESGNITTTATSYLIPNLPSGTYTITLLDGNWCTDTEVITVNSVNNISITTVGNNGVCDSPASIDIFITGGAPSYTVSWTGSSVGSTIVNTNSYHLPNLIAGTYSIVVTDVNGCTDGETVVVYDIDNTLDIVTAGFNAGCDDLGNIHVGIAGGQAPFTINWSGPVNGSDNVSGQSYNIDNLIAGTYSITVIDANGCQDMEIVTILEEEGSLDAVFTVYNGFCGGLGNIWMDFNSGNAPYQITWTGIVSGTATTNTTYYDVLDLPTGTYQVTIVDANGCSYTETVVITNIVNTMTASLDVFPGGCGMPGAINVIMSGGTTPYTVEWTSVNSSGSQSTNNNSYLLQNLPTGIYYITASDANGCDVDLNVQLINHPNNLVVNSTVFQPTCNQAGSVGLIVNGGQPPFDISWTGAESGSTSVNSSNYIISGLTGGTYTITVSDSGDCSSVQNVHLDESTDTPMVGFTYTISGESVAFYNTSAQGSYQWNFGDGNTSTLESPVHEFSGSGSYQVCLTVTNSCGTATYCETIVIMTSADAVILDVEEMTTTSNTSSLSLPIVIHNCDMIVSLAGSIFVEDEAVASVTGVSGGIIMPQYNVLTNSFNFYDNTAQGVPVQDGDILFYLELEIHGANGTSTNVRIVDDPLAIEVGSMVNNVATELPHIVVPGSVNIQEQESGFVIGNVRTFRGDAINNVTVSALSAGNEVTTATNESGNYSFDDGIIPGQMATVIAAKDGDPANGLSTYALFLGQRFILGMEPIQIYSPYQIIAGDANCNGSFSTLDLFIIQQLIIGAADDFANCPSWVFVADGLVNMPEDFTSENVFPYPVQNTMMVDQTVTADFIGVKVGDILGNSNPDELQPEEVEDRTEHDVTLVLENKPVSAGEIISIDMTSTDFINLVSLQAGIAFDQELFTYHGFTPGNSPRLANMVANQIDGEIRLSWFDLQGAGYSTDGEEVIFTVELEAKEYVSDLLSALTISDRNIQVNAYDVNGDQHGIILGSTEVTNTVDITKDGFKLYQNQPNPFKKSSVIRFDLPETMEVEMIFHNSLGEIVKRVTIKGTKGMNKMELSQLNMESGVYYYSLKAGAFTDTKSMIIVR